MWAGSTRRELLGIIGGKSQQQCRSTKMNSKQLTLVRRALVEVCTVPVLPFAVWTASRQWRCSEYVVFRNDAAGNVNLILYTLDLFDPSILLRRWGHAVCAIFVTPPYGSMKGYLVYCVCFFVRLRISQRREILCACWPTIWTGLLPF